MPEKGPLELLGWLENWGPDIKWWDNNMPGRGSLLDEYCEHCKKSFLRRLSFLQILIA